MRRLRYIGSVDAGPFVEMVGYASGKAIPESGHFTDWGHEVRRENRLDDRGW